LPGRENAAVSVVWDKIGEQVTLPRTSIMGLHAKRGGCHAESPNMLRTAAPKRHFSATISRSLAATALP
jgi:hypothetical protein